MEKNVSAGLDGRISCSSSSQLLYAVIQSGAAGVRFGFSIAARHIERPGNERSAQGTNTCTHAHNHSPKG